MFNLMAQPTPIVPSISELIDLIKANQWQALPSAFKRQ